MAKLRHVVAGIVGALLGCADTSDLEEARGALSSGVPAAASSEGWTATAHTPALIDRETVQGTFTLERLEGELVGRGGGGCLVADMFGRVPCEYDTQCRDLLGPPPRVDGLNGWHYCMSSDGSSDKICYTRPGNNCRTGASYFPEDRLLRPGTYQTRAVPVRFQGKKLKWRTLVCMASADFPGGCGLVDDNSRSVKGLSTVLGDEQ